MGIDLYMLPVNGDCGDLVYSHLVFDLDRNAILEDVRKVAEEHGVELPHPLACFLSTRRDGEYGYGNVRIDAYGEPLQYVLAQHLKPLAKKVGLTFDTAPPDERPSAWDRVDKGTALKRTAKPVKHRVGKKRASDGYASQLNRAVFAFICALPDDYKIVLYWH